MIHPVLLSSQECYAWLRILKKGICIQIFMRIIRVVSGVKEYGENGYGHGKSILGFLQFKMYGIGILKLHMQ